jgi:hypothetical protein
MEAREIHGYKIIAYVFTEMQQGKECGIVLVDRECDGDQYVTGWYRDGDVGWNHGHYFTDRIAAVWDMTTRAVGAPPSKGEMKFSNKIVWGTT